MNKIDRILTKTYRLYSHKLYPRLKHLRGFTRIKQVLDKLSRRGIEKVSQSECDGIFEEDWDNLIILDACRHDLYEEVNGETDYRYSLGGTSGDYIKENFSEGEYDDIVYITANVHFHETQFEKYTTTSRNVDDVFHTIFHTYQDKWDEELGTVRPEAVVEDAKTAEKLFPEKRKIIHFMQPHVPFIESQLADGFERPNKNEKRDMHALTLADIGKLNHKEVWKAYKKNLEHVMPHAEKLVDNLEGRTVITADHGNLMGENSRYGHFFNDRSEPLRKVPLDRRQ
jgi:hypothetical protein